MGNYGLTNYTVHNPKICEKKSVQKWAGKISQAAVRVTDRTNACGLGPTSDTSPRGAPLFGIAKGYDACEENKSCAI
jgi:hypothetical protein